ncbi:digestive organ expansion factor [Capsaspora owczarzaki ATCC 30864]|uniref:Digestive organ expansion factor n=1 Tax=Capsaspora owczarzaki (strain ATCC 30864) TaxID=595528 RepID=A0A0D2VV85_CAPO3|nr:digestive organ expansion factor [Capsaspora owczarzaki ATCC 30864]KJE95372.1 digestive organ expansion factor [Capsaspora owczarzaki ATCC 30864]|eukprot:XP_004345415.1 digestive organ expansion factor [Capsaspora owczarzaki ATCC 30864]
MAKGRKSNGASANSAAGSSATSSGRPARGGLSRADKEQLLEFGQLHPVDIEKQRMHEQQSGQQQPHGAHGGRRSHTSEQADLDLLADRRTRIVVDESMASRGSEDGGRGRGRGGRGNDKRRRNWRDVGGPSDPDQDTSSQAQAHDEEEEYAEYDDEADANKPSSYDALLGSLRLTGNAALLLKRQRLEEEGLEVDQDDDEDNQDEDEEQLDDEDENQEEDFDEEVDEEVDDEDDDAADEDGDDNLDENGEELVSDEENNAEEDEEEEDGDDDDDDDAAPAEKDAIDNSNDTDSENEEGFDASSDEEDEEEEKDTQGSHGLATLKPRISAKKANAGDFFAAHFKHAIQPAELKQLTQRQGIVQTSLTASDATTAAEILLTSSATKTSTTVAGNLATVALDRAIAAINAYSDVLYPTCMDASLTDATPFASATSSDNATPASIRLLAGQPVKPPRKGGDLPTFPVTNHHQVLDALCAHVARHAKRTRARVVKDNQKISTAHAEGVEPGEYRDQGFTRPRVLILAPFRSSALRIVHGILAHLGNELQVGNRKRFNMEYGVDAETAAADESKERPDDFKATFSGNIDDCFKIGIKISRKNVKLFSDFYSADIIVASPLGLKLIIGSEGDKKRDFDFLSSIEILALDQTEVFSMQNWDHVIDVLSHLNRLPKNTRDTDFSRVREWNLNDWSKFYRQTIILSAHLSPEILALMRRISSNFSGRLIVQPTYPGCISRIVNQVPQVFHRFECDSYSNMPDARFAFFREKIVPALSSSAASSHTALMIPSYFDFVRVRNFLKKEEIDFSQISEYSSGSKVARARTEFFHGHSKLLVFTERFYFFHRYRLRGIRTLVMYALPDNAQFYPELVNYVDVTGAVSSTADPRLTVLYTQLDANRLARVVGTARAERMIASDKSTHMFC